MSRLASVASKALALLFVVLLFLALIVYFSMSLAALLWICITAVGCVFPTLPTPSSTGLFMFATALVVLFFSYLVYREKKKLEQADI